MMLSPKVRRSMMAAQSLGSVKVLVQPLKFSFEDLLVYEPERAAALRP
jgi:hypothetical protein